jgi:LysR family nitrogen assimilation transcriptional regulator
MATPKLKASQFDIRPLYYFVRVAEAGSFSRAAASLSVGQPLLSRVIRRLEEDFGVQLLHRTGRGVQLNEAGQRLLEHARAVIGRLVDAQHDVAALSGKTSGSVSLGLPPFLGSSIAIRLVEQLRAEHPGIGLTLREGYAAETLDWLGNGQVDAAMVYNPPQIATLVIEHLFDDTLHLVGKVDSLGLLPGSSFYGQMLGSLPLILPPRPHRLRGLVEFAAREAGVELQVATEVAGTMTVLELVRAGLGYTILPSMLIAAGTQEGRFLSWPLVEPEINPSLCLVTSMQKPLTEATRVVLKTAAALLRQRPVA